MPLLAQLLVTLSGAFSTFLGAILAARVAVRLAAIAAAATFAGLLLLLFNTTVAPLAAQMFETPYGSFIGLAFPPIAGTCLATFVGVWVGCTAYALKVKAVRMSSSI